MTDLSVAIDARLQCTHQFDLASLAVTAAARNTAERRYDAVVEDGRDGVRRAFLRRDGAASLEWTLDGWTIVSPGGLAGVSLSSGFTGTVAAGLDAEAAEAALVLRRAVFISSGRGMTERLDAIGHAPARGGCWVEQPERAEAATRMRGSTHDFTGRRDRLTRDDDAWLAFEDWGRSI